MNEHNKHRGKMHIMTQIEKVVWKQKWCCWLRPKFEVHICVYE